MFQINFSSSLLSNDIAHPDSLLTVNFACARHSLDDAAVVAPAYDVKCENSFFFIFTKKKNRKEKTITLFTMNTHCKLFDFQHERWVKLCIFLFISIFCSCICFHTHRPSRFIFPHCTHCVRFSLRSFSALKCCIYF